MEVPTGVEGLRCRWAEPFWLLFLATLEDLPSRALGGTEEDFVSSSATRDSTSCSGLSCGGSAPGLFRFLFFTTLFETLAACSWGMANRA